MFSPPLKKSIVFLKYALKMDLVKGAWFDLYIEPDVQPFKDAVEPVYEKLGFAELRQQIYKEIGKTE